VNLNEEVEVLRNIPLFSKIEPARLKLLAFTSDRLTFQEGQDLCVQGEMGNDAFIIVEGACDVIISTPGGPIKVAEAHKYAFVGEIAILCDVPRTATVRARTKVTVLRITKELFFRMVLEFPQMGVEVMRELAARLERTNIQLREARTALAAAPR